MALSTTSGNDEVAKAIAAAASAAVTDDNGPPTLFDKIVTGAIPCNKVYEDDTVLAYRDINPQAPVHILVIPKHRDGLTQLSKAIGSNKEVLGHLLFVAGQIGQKECPNGFRLVVNDGADGAQSVYHLHIHIMGGRQMGWPPG
jgi:histidine triad (HIT) family protein